MKRRTSAILILCSLVWAVPLAAHANGSSPDVQITQVDHSSYPEVTVYVSVTDAGGKVVSGLVQDDFRVTEDGLDVQIVGFQGGEGIAISTVLVIDRSGSMNSQSKMTGAKQAALTFVELMRSQDQAALIAFDHVVSVDQPFTTDKSSMEAAISALHPRGDTAWRDALHQAVDLIGSTSGRRSIILLTDGLDNRSRYSLSQATQRASDQGIPVYAIGLGKKPTGWLSGWLSGGGYDETSLKHVAQETKGRFYHAPSADELEALYESLAVGMQKEYAITYHSPRPTYDGTRREIVVSVQGVEGRGGYLEKHLLNIHSDPLVGIACLAPLLAAAVVPLTISGLRRRRSSAASQPTPGPQPVSSSAACSNCGASIRPRARFCPRCGAGQSVMNAVQLAQAMCPHCGSELRSGAKFCNRCGNRL